VSDGWENLRRYTPARIALGRAGCSLRTESLLDFQLAHALARDAVHQPWDVAAFAERVAILGLEAVVLSTRVQDRTQYLLRPDLGRALDSPSRQRLAALAGAPPELALVFSNGLSSTAIERHGLALLAAITEILRGGDWPVAATPGDQPIYTGAIKLAPVCLVPDGRVALSDEIGSLLGARAAAIVVGERPGLSAADSLGIYLTHGPRRGNTDADRNCISNIRPPEGLDCWEAAAKFSYLFRRALHLGFSGVALKDDLPAPQRLAAAPAGGR